ncbi:MAG: 3-keto-5-aminohexanoate cleavage protein [Candidatus Poribacteria bacterium]|nr:3-keto-5-aminohexanoate cleavage protein [Candidatus Poribacteria bacterium]
MEKTIITAAVSGSRPTKEMHPAVPYTPKAIAQAAIECCRAGAAIAHIHVRDPETGAPSSKIKLFREVVDRIRQECDIVINLTTSGLNLTGENIIEARLEPVTLNPEICSLDIGSMNFRDKAFVNPPEWGRTAAQRMREHNVKPEIEVFDVGHIGQAVHWIDEGLIDAPPYFQLCMGAGWGIAATPENLLFMQGQLPANVPWSVLGVGRMQLPMITMGMLLGGHIRVGFEDNIYLRKGVLAKNNAQMVEVAVNLVEQLQREVATPSEARRILGLSNGAIG